MASILVVVLGGYEGVWMRRLRDLAHAAQSQVSEPWIRLCGSACKILIMPYMTVLERFYSWRLGFKRSYRLALDGVDVYIIQHDSSLLLSSIRSMYR
jgi:hypothetical protein